jgi:hypothetical protein
MDKTDAQMVPAPLGPVERMVRLGAEAPPWWKCDTHGPATPNAWGCPECVREMRAEIAELDALRDKLAGILSRTAVALRGPEPPLTRWSWHDLPERAAAAIAAIDLMQRTAQHLAAGRPHDSDCAMHNAPAYPAGECDCGALGPNAQAHLHATARGQTK